MGTHASISTLLKRNAWRCHREYWELAALRDVPVQIQVSRSDAQVGPRRSAPAGCHSCSRLCSGSCKDAKLPLG